MENNILTVRLWQQEVVRIYRDQRQRRAGFGETNIAKN